jgi:hypothetical protein
MEAPIRALALPTLALLAAACIHPRGPSPGHVRTPPQPPTQVEAAPRATMAETANAPPEAPLVPIDLPPFAGQTTVTVAELLQAIATAARELQSDPVVEREYSAFLARHRLDRTLAPYDQYAVVRVVFEATRDGGLWGLVWNITNREGHSDRIWKQWQRAAVPEPGEWGVTAVAECDELSALFAFLVRRLGVKHAGFLDGGPNHIVAHWTLHQGRKRETRVVVPTSQIYLSRTATLGTDEINPYKIRVVWDYWRRDVKPTHTIPAPLARYFVEQLPLAALPQAELQRRRNLHGRS